MIEDIVGLLHQVTISPFRVSMMLDPRLNWIYADRQLVDRVLVNLAISAYDALQSGGALEIRTANVDLGAAAAREAGLDPGVYSQVEFDLSGGSVVPHGAIAEIARRAGGGIVVRESGQGHAAVAVLFPSVTFANSTLGSTR